MNDIILDPEYAKLLEDIEKLKNDITKLYEEKDELQFHICKNIETEYMSKVGVLEYKVYEFECKLLRLKRKIELIQAKINRQEKINYEEIEKQLDIECEEYERKLRDMSDNLQIALDRMNCGMLSEEETHEIKKIYRKLIKKLHPDLNNENNEKNKNILNQVIRAYENSDLITMRNLEILCDEIVDREIIAIGELEDLKKTKIKYENIVNNILEKINKIKVSFPYNQREFLKNNILIEKRKSELDATLKMYKDVYRQLEKTLDEMKGK